jgi:Uma2 family endonuclease
VAFISAARLPGGELPEKFLRGAPDLAVEVLSPSDTLSRVEQKASEYIEAGARLVWIIAGEAKTATVYRADGSARLLGEHESLEGEDVLPGLTIPIAELFH